MRILASVAAAAVLLLGAPVALAHQGSPNFLSQINSIDPATEGITVTVLNRDDRLLLQNTSGQDVVVKGYSEEPYARVDADGTVQVNTDSEAYYLNEERDGEGRGARRGRPEGRAALEGGLARPAASSGTTTACTGWPRATRRRSRTRTCARRSSTGRSRCEVGGTPAAITGTLFWTPRRARGAPLGAIFAFGRPRDRALRRRRDRASPPRGAGDRDGRVARRRPGEPRARHRPARCSRAARRRCAQRARDARREHARARRARSTRRPARSTLRFSEPRRGDLRRRARLRRRGRARCTTGNVFHPERRQAEVAVRLRRGLPTAATRPPTASSRPTRTRSPAATCSRSATARRPRRRSAELLDGEGAGPVTSVGFGVARGTQYAAIALGLGALLFLAAVLAPRPARGRRRRCRLARRLGGVRHPAAARCCSSPRPRASSRPRPRSSSRARPPAARACGRRSARACIGDVLGTRFGLFWGLGILAWLLAGALAATRPGTVPVLRPASVGATGLALPGRRRPRGAGDPARRAGPAAGARRPRERAGAGLAADARERRARGRHGGLARRHRRAGRGAARRDRAARRRRPHASAGRGRRALLGARRRGDRAAAGLRHRAVGSSRSHARAPLRQRLRPRRADQDRRVRRDRRARLGEPPAAAAAAAAGRREPDGARPRRPAAAAHAARRAGARARRARRHRRARRLRAVDRREQRPRSPRTRTSARPAWRSRSIRPAPARTRCTSTCSTAPTAASGTRPRS